MIDVRYHLFYSCSTKRYTVLVALLCSWPLAVAVLAIERDSCTWPAAPVMARRTLQHSGTKYIPDHRLLVQTANGIAAYGNLPDLPQSRSAIL
jgi:hypothetical protein